MTVTGDSVRVTLVTVEKLRSIDEVCCQCIANSNLTELVPAGHKDFFSIASDVVKDLLAIREPTVEEKRAGVRKVLEKTKKIFDEFLRSLDHPEQTPSDATLNIASLARLPVWPSRLIHLHQLLNCDLPLEIKKAERLVAPYLLHTITANSVPLDALKEILQAKEINEVNRIHLSNWVESLSKNLAPQVESILINVFRDVSHRLWKNKSEEAREDDAFFLALLLNNKFPTLFSLTREKEVFKNCLCIVDSTRGQGHPPSTVMKFGSPIVAGIVWQYLSKGENLFPMIKVRETHIPEGTLVLEECISSLTNVNWGNAGVTPENTQLLHALADIVKRALKLCETLKLQTGDFLITQERKICVWHQIESGGKFFSLQTIERFIIEACKNDRERIRYVMKQSGFLGDPYAQRYSLFLTQAQRNGQEYLQEIPDFEDIVSGLRPSATSVFYKEVQKWGKDLILGMQALSQHFDSPVPMERVIRVIRELQEELGFVSIVPQNFAAEMVRKLKPGF